MASISSSIYSPGRVPFPPRIEPSNPALSGASESHPGDSVPPAGRSRGPRLSDRSTKAPAMGSRAPNGAPTPRSEHQRQGQGESGHSWVQGPMELGPGGRDTQLIILVLGQEFWAHWGCPGPTKPRPGGQDTQPAGQVLGRECVGARRRV